MRTALVLVHDADPSRGHRLVGTLRPAREARGLAVVVGTTVGPSPLLTGLPDPAGLPEAAALVPGLRREIAGRAPEAAAPRVRRAHGQAA